MRGAPADGADLLCLPYDGGNGVDWGAREAPAALLAGLPDSWTGEARVRAVADGGDLRSLDLSADLPAEGRLLVTLGGDHSISYPVVAALSRRSPLSILWLDAHTDCDDSRPGLLTHKNVLRHLLALPGVERAVVAGPRGFTPGDERDMGGDRLRVVPCREILEAGSAGLVDRLADGQRWYVSIDVDVLDPSVAPATATPVPGGLGWRALEEILEGLLGRLPVVGLDLVEIAPRLDPGGGTLLGFQRLLRGLVGR